jgi:hypothetical protein
LTDFPVLVKLTSANFNFSKARSDGYDIRFTSSDGTTLLKYERERHDATHQVAEYWVKVPAVSGTVNTDFYIYYGKSDATDGADPTNVWDANFYGVWHKKDDPDTSHIKDSTSYARNGTKVAANEPIEADGKIGKAQNYDGSNDKITLTAPNFSAWTEYTTEGWLYADTFPGGTGRAIGWGGGGFNTLHLYATNEIWSSWRDSNRVWYDAKQSGYSTLTWYHVVSTWKKNDRLRLYINGVEVNSVVVPDLFTGQYTGFTFGEQDGAYYFDGKLDEMRLSNSARSAAWIKASYHSGNDTLVSYGSEEVAAVGRSYGYIF